MTPQQAAHAPLICPHCGAPSSPRLLVAQIQAVVAAYYGIDARFMSSDHRDRQYAHPRQVAMFLSHELTQRSFPEIGRRFNRDHTTIIHAVRAVRNRASRDPELALDVAFLRGRLTPVETGESRDFSPRGGHEHGKEQSGNTQEERLAA